MANRGKGCVATTIWVDHWFGRLGLKFYIKFVSNCKLLTKITIASELGLLNEISVMMVI